MEHIVTPLWAAQPKDHMAIVFNQLALASREAGRAIKRLGEAYVEFSKAFTQR